MSTMTGPRPLGVTRNPDSLGNASGGAGHVGSVRLCAVKGDG